MTITKRRSPTGMPIYEIEDARNLLATSNSYNELTYKHIASEAKVHPQTASRFLRGITRFPRFSTVVGISRAMGYSTLLKKD